MSHADNDNLPEEALSDPRDNKSLLGDYLDHTKKIKATSDGSLNVNVAGLHSEAGGQKQIFVQDEVSRNLLNSILKQLKITNMHLALMSDNYIKTSDLEI